MEIIIEVEQEYFHSLKKIKYVECEMFLNISA